MKSLTEVEAFEDHDSSKEDYVQLILSAVAPKKPITPRRSTIEKHAIKSIQKQEEEQVEVDDPEYVLGIVTL